MNTIKLNVRVDDHNKIEYSKRFYILDDYTVKKIAAEWLHEEYPEYNNERIVSINSVDVPSHENRNAEMTKYCYFNIVTEDESGDTTSHYVAAPQYYDYSIKNYKSTIEIFLYPPFSAEPENFSFIKSDYDGLGPDEAVDSCYEELKQNAAELPEEIANEILTSLRIFFES